MARASGTGHLGTWSRIIIPSYSAGVGADVGGTEYEDVGILIETGGGSS